MKDIWTYNEKHQYGLYDDATLGLVRDGYKFLGRSTQKTGGTVFKQDDVNAVPTDIYSEIINKSTSVTMYAQRKANTVNVFFDANGGTVNDPTGDYYPDSTAICKKSKGGREFEPWIYNEKLSYGLLDNTTMCLSGTG